MFRRSVRLAALTLMASGVLLANNGYGQHGQPRESLKIGDQAVEWGSLPATDGSHYRLADIDSKLVVVVFGCHHCPVHVAYEERLKKIQDDYKDKDVAVIVLNPNNMWGEDTLDRMKKRAAEKEYNFVYINDASQESGHKYGARVTPHIFVLDADRVVRYIGGIDDSQNPANVKQHHLRNALDALLDGQDPPRTETRAFGCTVKYN
ncbi:MAG: thioredoxin family protein [Planctomycetaceae bacterium]|nr:MAG: thioredoxin family protein [Planctomycetaceae bacterium]